MQASPFCIETMALVIVSAIRYCVPGSRSSAKGLISYSTIQPGLPCRRPALWPIMLRIALGAGLLQTHRVCRFLIFMVGCGGQAMEVYLYVDETMTMTESINPITIKTTGNNQEK
jgi:hypothetical protein